MKTKKLFLTIIIINFIIINSSFGQDGYVQKNSLKENELNGKVKFVKQILYDGVIKFGKVYKSTIEDLQDWEYNKKGNLVIKNSYYSSDGNLLSRVKYDYDLSGNLTEINVYDENGDLGTSITYGYDKNDFLNLRKTYYKGNIISFQKYINDEFGNTLMESTYKANGSLKDKWEYSYDEFENEIESVYYDSNNSVQDRFLKSFKYNNQGQIIEKERKRERIEYTYDLNGNIINSKYFDEDGNYDGEHSITYDDSNNEIETTSIDKFGKIETISEQKFDVNGNLIERNTYLKDKSSLPISWVKYQYDNYNNWIKETSFIKAKKYNSFNKDRIRYIERYITYFN